MELQETPPKKSSSKSGLIFILGIAIVLLLGAVAFLTYSIFKSDGDTSDDEDKDTVTEENDTNDEEKEEEDTEEEETPDEEEEEEEPEEEETEDECADSELPSGWIPVDNATYGYTLGMPDTWWYRFFGGAKTLGLDPSEIPEASEYAGKITFTAYSDSLTTVVNREKSNHVDLSESTITVCGRSWTKITGKTPSDDAFFPDQKVALAITSVGSYTYELYYRAESSQYSTYLPIFNQVLSTIKFD